MRPQPGQGFLGGVLPSGAKHMARPKVHDPVIRSIRGMKPEQRIQIEPWDAQKT